MAQAQALTPGFWPPTPRWLTQQLLAEHPIPTDTVIDVGAGDGAITEVLVEAGKRVLCIEPRPECRPQLEWYVGANNVFTADAERGLAHTLPITEPGDATIICAPPFGDDAAACIVPIVQHGGPCAILLMPESWLPCPPMLSQRHVRPADAIYWPASGAWFHGFGPASVAWAVWDEAMRAEGRQRHAVLPGKRLPR